MPTLRAGSDVSSSISVAPGRRGTTALLIAAAIGGAVSVAVGVYAQQHDPTNEQLLHVGFPSTLSMKAWLTTGVFVLAIAQARVGGLDVGSPAPRRRGAADGSRHAHRWTGTAAFLLALPVAYHCLWSLGWRSTDARVVVHGVLGCAFFGAVTTKLLALRIDGAPRWALPVLGEPARRRRHRDLADVVAVVLHHRRVPGTVRRAMALRFTPTLVVCAIGAVVTGGLLALPPADDDATPAPPPSPRRRRRRAGRSSRSPTSRSANREPLRRVPSYRSATPMPRRTR